MMSHNAMLADFADDCKLRGISTTDVYRNTARRFLEWLDEQGGDPLHVDRLVLKRYLHHLKENRKLANSSTKIEFIRLSSFFDYLVETELISVNLIPAFSKRFVRVYKSQEPAQKRLLTIEEASHLVRSTLDSRDRAILVVLLKTGIRRHELVELDVGDVDIEGLTIKLKPTPKRSNRQVFFDFETAEILRRWLHARSLRAVRDESLFPSHQGTRMSTREVFVIVKKHAARCGLNPPGGKDYESFSPHACRHWFSTYLLRAGMRREYVQWLRGDAIKEAVDIYFHIDHKDVQEAYLKCIPQLGL